MDRCALLTLSVLGLVLLLSWFPVGLSASSGIIINIDAGATAGESTVNATGQLVHIITNSERASFGIGSDRQLKQAVGKYFGKRPNDAFLHSPTPWGDLYKCHGWPQVERVLQPIKAVILGISTKPTIVATATLTNRSNKRATFTKTISRTVANTMSSEWSNSNSVSVEQTISYKIGTSESNVGGETTFGFEHSWGMSETIEKQTTLGTETGVSVELDPEESAIVELTASSGKMDVRIIYEAYLRGVTAVNYHPKYKGRHYHPLPIQNVLGGSNSVQIIEDVEVGFYSNAQVTVRDAKSNRKKTFFLGDHPHEPVFE